MTAHTCQASTATAVRLQILNGVLDTPRVHLRDRFSDRQLLLVEEEAHRLDAELRLEGRCLDCGQPQSRVPGPRPTPPGGMAAELAYVWGA